MRVYTGGRHRSRPKTSDYSGSWLATRVTAALCRNASVKLLVRTLGISMYADGDNWVGIIIPSV